MGLTCLSFPVQQALRECEKVEPVVGGGAVFPGVLLWVKGFCGSTGC